MNEIPLPELPIPTCTSGLAQISSLNPKKLFGRSGPQTTRPCGRLPVAQGRLLVDQVAVGVVLDHEAICQSSKSRRWEVVTAAYGTEALTSVGRSAVQAAPPYTARRLLSPCQKWTFAVIRCEDCCLAIHVRHHVYCKAFLVDVPTYTCLGLRFRYGFPYF